MNRIEIITSVERRRRWSLAEKERWVAALEEPGAFAAEVAAQSWGWSEPFVSLASAIGGVAPSCFIHSGDGRPRTPAPVLEAAPLSAIQDRVCGGVCLKVEGAPDAGTLASVIDALSRAERRR